MIIGLIAVILIIIRITISRFGVGITISIPAMIVTSTVIKEGQK